MMSVDLTDNGAVFWLCVLQKRFSPAALPTSREHDVTTLKAHAHNLPTSREHDVTTVKAHAHSLPTSREHDVTTVKAHAHSLPTTGRQPRTPATCQHRGPWQQGRQSQWKVWIRSCRGNSLRLGQ